MDNFFQIFRNKTIYINIKDYLFKDKTIGCTLRYFIKYNNKFDAAKNDGLELLVTENDFLEYRDQMIDLQYKRSIRTVRFDNTFNKPIPIGFIPQCKEIIFGHAFNQELLVGSLCQGLESIVFHGWYDKELAVGVIPEGVKKISFKKFVYYLTDEIGYRHRFKKGVLPKTIEKMQTYSNNFEEVPYNLGHLKIIDPDFSPRWPTNLTKLTLCVRSGSTINFIPSTVLNLKLIESRAGNFGIASSTIESLPPNLKSLALFGTWSRPFSQGVLPESLETLDLLNCTFNQSLKDILPRNLKKIIFGFSFNMRIFPGDLPSSLEYCNFGHNFNQGPLASNITDPVELLDQVFPQSLLKLKFGHAFSHELTFETMPRSLTCLYLGPKYRHPIKPNLLPGTLKKLNIQCSEPFDVNVLPLGLEILKLNQFFNQPLLPGSIPVSVKQIYFGSRQYPSRFNQSIPEGVILNTVKEVIWYSDICLSKDLQVAIPPTTSFQCLHEMSWGNISIRTIAPLAGFINKSEVSCSFAMPKDFYPPSLKELVFYNYDSPFRLGDIPHGVEFLDLREYNAHPINKGVIPNSVKTLALPDHSNNIFKNNIIPQSIKKIIYKEEFVLFPTDEMNVQAVNPIDPENIPSSVETLILKKNINSPTNYNGPERTIIHHLDGQGINKINYFSFIGRD